MEIDGDCRARSHVNVQLMSDLMRRPNDITRSSKGSTLGSERTKNFFIAPIAGNECQGGRKRERFFDVAVYLLSASDVGIPLFLPLPPSER